MVSGCKENGGREGRMVSGCRENGGREGRMVGIGRMGGREGRDEKDDGRAGEWVVFANTNIVFFIQVLLNNVQVRHSLILKLTAAVAM